VPLTVVSAQDAIGIDELFARALDYERRGEHGPAAEQFDRVVELDPEGPFAAPALFNGALAHEGMLDFAGAAYRFEETARRFPQSGLTLSALTRGIRLRLHLEQWSLAGVGASTLLEQHPHAGPLEHIVAYGARALALLADQRTSEAEYFVAKALEIVERLQLDRAGRVPRDLAQLYFALGETRRQKGEAVKLPNEPARFAQTLEERCELLLAAQSAYSDSMRAYDAHWSAMAGYRVGELYGKLHQELMAIPPPPQAKTERQRQLFEGAMRLRYSVLVSKALTMLEHTLVMAQRTGEASEWVQKSAAAKLDLERLLQQEQAAIDSLPYSREELQQALSNLEQRLSSP
jgi:hypothetical protein